MKLLVLAFEMLSGAARLFTEPPLESATAISDPTQGVAVKALK